MARKDEDEEEQGVPPLFDGPLTLATLAAIEGMYWLTDADKGTIELTLSYTRQIDWAIRYTPGSGAVKALYLGPHVLAGLKALGGTPESRGEFDEDKASQKVVSVLDELKAKRQQKRATS